MHESLPDEYYSLLADIQAVDFVLVDLTLYLDTHPHDAQALEQFNHFAKYQRQVKQVFESKFGPLLQYGNSTSEGEWKWGQSPWPWQA
ncbi:spore coat protein CotJB [Ectobacillus sp. sgz5001026]|uniref:spore coat protein CotJB n=1 Tax=Ectobacillus sp. sgz5001026 TaxID=3242473 RepID=UPI0036D33FA1